MFSPHSRLEGLALIYLLLAAPAAAKESSRPSLGQISKVLLTTAWDDFEGDDAGFGAATAWHGDKLLERPSRKAPHLACADYGQGRRAMKKLEGFLSEAAIRRASNSKDDGTCVFATASSSEAATVSQDLEAYGLTSFGPVPSALKLAPGLLSHERKPRDSAGAQQHHERLATTHGKRMRFENVVGLDVALSPGVLPIKDRRAGAFISDLLDGLMAASVDLHANNFWSDASLPEDLRADPWAGAALRSWEWRRAADVVHELSTEVGGPTPGDVCSWGDLRVHHAGSDFLMIKGETKLKPTTVTRT